MLKRGQITVFVMIGLVIFLTLGYFWYARSSEYEVNYNFKESDKIKIKNAVQQCLESSLDTGLDIMKFGYVNFSEERSAPLFYSNGINRIPTLESFSTDLGFFIDKQMVFCLENNKKDFEFDRYSLSFKTPKTTVLFSKDAIDVSMNLEVISNSTGNQLSLDSFKTERLIRFQKIWAAANDILEKTKEDPAAVPLDFLLEQEQEITLTEINQSNIIYYTIIDQESELNNEPYAYSFAVQLEGEIE